MSEKDGFAVRVAGAFTGTFADYSAARKAARKTAEEVVGSEVSIYERRETFKARIVVDSDAPVAAGATP